MVVCVFGCEISALDGYVLKALKILIGLNGFETEWSRGWYVVCMCACACVYANLAVSLLATWFTVRSLSQANYCITAPPVRVKWTHREMCIASCHQTGTSTGRVGILLLIIKKKKKKKSCELYLRFPSNRLFSLNVSASSCTCFFFFLLRDDLLKGHHLSPGCPGFFKGCCIFFNIFFTNVESQSCTGSITEAAIIK